MKQNNEKKMEKREWYEKTLGDRPTYNNSKGGFRPLTCIPFDMGRQLGMESVNSFILDVINNIPTVAYNYDYGVHVGISLASIFMGTGAIYEGIDTVLDSIRLKLGVPIEPLGEREIIVNDKKSMARAILSRKYDTIHIVGRGDNAALYGEMQEYVDDVLRRFLYCRAHRIIVEVFMTIIRYEK